MAKAATTMVNQWKDLNIKYFLIVSSAFTTRLPGDPTFHLLSHIYKQICLAIITLSELIN